MTVGERIESQSFAYDPQFPPDCAEGQPLSSMARPAPPHPKAIKRAKLALKRAKSHKG
jgi:hypothetical protein